MLDNLRLTTVVALAFALATSRAEAASQPSVAPRPAAPSTTAATTHARQPLPQPPARPANARQPLPSPAAPRRPVPSPAMHHRHRRHSRWRLHSDLGQRKRTAGAVLMALGGVLAVGMPVATYFVENGLPAHCMSAPGFDLGQAIGCALATSGMLEAGTIFTILGLVAAGIGAKLYATGQARAALHADGARGTPAVYWLGWVFSGAAAAALGAWAGLLTSNPDTFHRTGMQALIIGGATAGAAGVVTFALGATFASHHLPAPRVGVASGVGGKRVTTIGLALSF